MADLANFCGLVINLANQTGITNKKPELPILGNLNRNGCPDRQSLDAVTVISALLLYLIKSYFDIWNSSQASLKKIHLLLCDTTLYIVIMSLICNKQKQNLYTGHEKVKGRAAQRASYHLHNNNHNTVRRSAHAHNTTQPVSTPAIYYASSQ